MSLYYAAQTEDHEEVVTLWVDLSGVVVVPDSTLLFGGSYFRVGPDLYIVSDGAAHFRVPDYFALPQAADLQDLNGAILRGDLVERLAGPEAPGLYAQTGEGTAASPIGQVETVEGGAAVQRVDGTVGPAEVGTPIFQGDVLSTQADSAVSATFVDGTVFTLSASSRMVVDSFVYDPGAADNAGSFSLIQGNFVFIAGQVAGTGGMDVTTPSSTMGIRGTTVIVEVGTIDGVDTSEVSLTTDPDGDQGRVELRDNDGTLLAMITQTDTKWIVSGATGTSREVERTLLDDAEDNLLIAEAFAAFRSAEARAEAEEDVASLPASGRRGAAGPQSPAALTEDMADDGVAAQAPAEVEDPQEADDVAGGEGLITPLAGLDPAIVTVSGLEDATITGDIAPGTGGAGFSMVTGPGNGRVIIAPDGQFSYVPAPDFNGSDSFTFVATDPDGAVFEGTVMVAVAPVNDAPQARDSAEMLAEDGVLTGAIVASDVDGDALVFEIAAEPQNGELTLFANGTYSYRPESDFAGSDSFAVTVTDPAGLTAEATVAITITAVNDAPVITSVTTAARGTVTEDAPDASVSGQVTASDPDPEATVTWSGTSMAMFGTFAITAAGAWTYTLDNTLADPIAEGARIVETFTAVATDAEGASATQIIEVTLIGTNDAPAVSANTVFETVRDSAVVGQLSAEDVDSSGALIFLPDAAPRNGSVAINADGSFSYTPDPGFVGLDRFSYRVIDAQGGVSVGQVTAAVEATAGGPVAQRAVLDLSGAATDTTPAGLLSIDVTAIEAVNLFIAMDGSGSIGAADWAVQRDMVREAVAQLVDRFEGTGVTINVEVMAFSDRTLTTGPLDLRDPDLPQTILELPYLRGGTDWNLAFGRARAFVDGQPGDAENVMLFITDGVPSNEAWRGSLQNLTAPADGASPVSIQAFTIGDGVDPALLEQIDPTPTALQSADDLAGALTGLVPRLISLDVTLEADGVDLGTIATEDSPGLVSEGPDYQLPLASIENIEALLGVDNRVHIRANLDLDGDASTAEVELFSSEVIGRQEDAQNTAGLSGADLLFGSDLADTISGGEGADVILGYDGADLLDGGAGADVLRAGGGDDVLRVADGPGAGRELLDGGAGRDVLDIDLGGDLNAELLPSLDLRDIEAIDMANDMANTLQITLADVVDLSSTGDATLETLLEAALPESAVIYGDSADSLTLVGDAAGGFQKVSDTPVDDGNGTALDIYAYVEDGNVLATLGVDTDIEVSGAVPVG